MTQVDEAPTYVVEEYGGARIELPRSQNDHHLIRSKFESLIKPEQQTFHLFDRSYDPEKSAEMFERTLQLHQFGQSSQVDQAHQSSQADQFGQSSQVDQAHRSSHVDQLRQFGQRISPENLAKLEALTFRVRGLSAADSVEAAQPKDANSRPIEVRPGSRRDI